MSLRDVADLAGVSVKTVSNVVNGYAHVAPATRAKVEEALSRLDYRPNLSARNLRRGRTGVIALALPELDAPYFAELSRFVIDAAAEQRWLVVIEQTDGSLERERQILDGVRDHRVDGLILSPIAIGADDSPPAPTRRRWSCWASASTTARPTTWRSTTSAPPATSPST
ncbi:LacI family DNA-binding transcriptional regulator [Planomonospora parontospora]|uniref:LacI family DNA-binding transcriptional regulator n=1 Tax=Planomonospora parontospora TaxID=58119 RepID=UPI0036176FBB